MTTPQIRDKHRRAAAIACRSLKQITTEENAALIAAAENDLDNPPLTDDQLAALRRSTEISPGLVKAARRDRRLQR